MHENIIIFTDNDGKKRMICQFVIDLSNKSDSEKAIKTIREMAKVEEEKPKENTD
jgi:hypothetical protein